MNPPTLILVAGLPATGKTTLGEALARALGAVNFDSDKTRVALDFCGQYSASVKDHVYEVMGAMAEESLAAGSTVVVDATFVREAWRTAFEKIALRVGARVRWICLDAAEEAVRLRMHDARKYSEADFAVYQRLKAAHEPFNRPCLQLRSDQLALEEMVAAAIAYLAEPPEPSATPVAKPSTTRKKGPPNVHTPQTPAS